MAQNNIEKEFRDKLNLREITPSPAAWDRLDAMLTVAQEKKSNKSYAWMYIAAACIAILLVGSIFFRQSAAEQPTDQIEVVHQQQPIIEEQQLNVADDHIIHQSEVVSSDNKPAAPTTNKPVLSPQSEMKTTVIAIAENVDVHKRIEYSSKNDSAVTAQVDELLAVATPSTVNKKSSVKVDANSLLSQVDGEIELSFREKVIKSAGKNFQNVKVALANRNMQ